MLRSGANDLGGTLMEETISAHGGLVLRLVQVGQGPDRGRGRRRPPGETAHHPLRRGPRGAAAGRRPPTGTCRSCCRCWTEAGGGGQARARATAGGSTMIRPPVSGVGAPQPRGCVPMPARLPSWAWVPGLTTGAIAAVAVLAVQADQGHPAHRHRHEAGQARRRPRTPSSPAEGDRPGRRYRTRLRHRGGGSSTPSTRTGCGWSTPATPPGGRSRCGRATVDPGPRQLQHRHPRAEEPTTGCDGVPDRADHVLHRRRPASAVALLQRGRRLLARPRPPPDARTGGHPRGQEDGKARSGHRHVRAPRSRVVA
ncbi:hypothetical protein SGRIM128S_01803 [Streptomyces griseomycini]